MYENVNSKYCYNGTNILINVLDIKDLDTLKEYEQIVTSLKLLELEKNVVLGNFDIMHFCKIHKFLFEEIYPFSGMFRIENIAKDNFIFADWKYIEKSLLELLEKLKSENYLVGLNKLEISSRLAYYLSELNVIHPFREGNGRVSREFIRELALKNNYYLNFKLVSPTEFLQASINSVVDETDLKKIIYKCLENIN